MTAILIVLQVGTLLCKFHSHIIIICSSNTTQIIPIVIVSAAVTVLGSVLEVATMVIE